VRTLTVLPSLTETASLIKSAKEETSTALLSPAPMNIVSFQYCGDELQGFDHTSSSGGHCEPSAPQAAAAAARAAAARRRMELQLLNERGPAAAQLFHHKASVMDRWTGSAQTEQGGQRA